MNIKPVDKNKNILIRSEKEILEIVLSKCVKENDCLVYKGHCLKNKYGIRTYPLIYWNGHYYNGHRLVYHILKGGIGKSLVLHKCDNMQCVNIYHLYLGTHKDNAIDMSDRGRTAHQKKTHCVNGHEFSEDNIKYVVQKSGRPFRKCIACCELNRKKTMSIKECVFCFKKFLGYKNGKYCSKSCFGKHRVKKGTLNLGFKKDGV